jgi:cytosine/adenosine deaminase-related metal-dependent hydrolase
MRKIAAQYIFPLNGASPIRNGVLTTDDDGTILDVREMSGEEESTEFYNGILVPGFVNAHCHLELSHLHGKFERGTGMAGFIRQINALRDGSGRDVKIDAAREQLEKMYGEGVSAMADISNCNDTFEIKSASRMYIRTFLEVFGTEPADAPKIMEGVRSLAKEAYYIGLDAAPTPHSCYTMSPQLLASASSDALDEGWLSYHNQESMEEELLIKEGRGALARDYKARGLSTPPVTGAAALHYFLDNLEKTGKLADQNILLVHNLFTDESSMDRAISLVKNLYWAVCPLSNLFIHNFLPPLELMRAKGAVLTLGTDSLSSNDLLSMVDEIKCINNYFPGIELKEIFEWSSYNGALFLGLEESMGSFEKGKKPGVVLIEQVDWENMKLTDCSSSTRLV